MTDSNGRGGVGPEDDINHYIVLGLPSGQEGSKVTLKEIEKAYRNQSRLRHPDKRPDDPNATSDFQLLTSSFEVLRDEAARRSFDAKLRFRHERVLRDSFQDAKRRKMATDLEERERTAAASVDPVKETRRKEKMLAEELMREIAEFQARRAKKAPESVFVQENMKEKVGAHLDKKRMLKVSWETSYGDYSASKLRAVFERFGPVEDVVIRSKRSKSSKKKASAIIVMASREAAVGAIQSMSGDIANPLLVLPLEPIAGSFSSSSSANQHETVSPEFDKVVGTGFQDYEAAIMKKLQKANEMKKSTG